MQLPEMAANEPLVRSIMEHLIAAFNEFVDNYDGDIDYVDGFMAAHNFHVFLILAWWSRGLLFLVACFSYRGLKWNGPRCHFADSLRRLIL